MITNLEMEYLPWSGRRYIVRKNGVVTDINDRLINNKFIDEDLCVELEWVLGKKYYSIALLVMVTFNVTLLPAHLLDQIEPLYIDGNKKNVRIDNLTYRYKNGPIEVEGYKDFYYVPFNEKYCINENGILVNISTGKTKCWSVTLPTEASNDTGGYNYSRVVSNGGVSRTLFKHRALCYVFKTYGSDVHFIVVNHLDGDPTNNALNNIAWATYSENNFHAYQLGLRPNASKKILMLNLKDGEIKSFNSIEECARHLGYTRGSFISNRLINSQGKVFSDMLMFKYDDGTEWPNIDLNNIEICKNNGDNPIFIRNVFTDIVAITDNALDASRTTNVKVGTIHRHLKEKMSIPINGYLFRYADKDVKWPVFTDKHLAIFKSNPVYPGNGMTVLDISTNSELFFTSIAEAANHFKINKHIISKHVISKTPWNKKYLFSYFNIRNY